MLARVCRCDRNVTAEPHPASKAWRHVEDLYGATYPRLVATLTLVTGSRADPEDLVQEAFARLLPRWERVRLYDDPEGWVRSVAMREATSRWRRARVASAGLLRLGRRASDAAASSTSVDVADLLAGLPVNLRQVLVLHYGVGLSVAEVARALGVAEGTVKSRLSRARDAARHGARLGEEDLHA